MTAPPPTPKTEPPGIRQGMTCITIGNGLGLNLRKPQGAVDLVDLSEVIMKTLLSKPYFLIPLILVGLLVNGALLIGGLSLLAKVFAPEPAAEVVEPEQAPAQVAIKVEPPEATTTPEPPMVTLQDALPVGYKAATLAQTAKTKEEWNAVAKQWLAAIEILEEVPETSPDYSTAKAKRNEYLKNIEIANAKAQAASGDSAQPLPLTTDPDSSSSPVSTANRSRPKGTCLLREGYVIAI